MSVRRLARWLFALFSAAMLGLAAGAVWMVAALYLHHPVPWMAVPIGVLLAWVIRSSIRQPGGGAAAMAALATGLAAIYVNILIAGMRIAGSMGMGLIDALKVAGASMLWQLARLAMGPADLVWAIIGMLLAAWLAWWRRSR